MKVRFSPLISEARGSAGPIVASIWKGLPYFRERITPSNPQTVDQQAQRALMTRVVAWFKSLPALLKGSYDEFGVKTPGFMDLLAAGLPLSGANLFTRQNIAQQKADTDEWLVPPNTYAVPILAGSLECTPTAVTGALSWTPGLAEGTNIPVIFYGVVAEDEDEPDALVEADVGETLISTAAYSITDLIPETDYVAYLGVKDADADLVSTFRRVAFTTTSE